MASDVQESPFVKQLAANDRPTRDKALSSLRTYLTSNRSFTALELLKLWKGLFFCMWHTDRPLPQQHLATTLSRLLLPLPPRLFLPFLHAFWTTLARDWSSIDSLRLNKFLLLARRYLGASFLYLRTHGWDGALVAAYVQLVQEIPLRVGDGAEKVPDGLRFHVLDCWVEELDAVDVERVGPGEGLMEPVRRVHREGATKVVRARAGETLADGRVGSWVVRGGKGGGGGETDGDEDGKEDEEDEWGGLED